MSHPAEVAVEKQAGFMAALPWIMMAMPAVTQLIEKFTGGAAKKMPLFGRAAKSVGARGARAAGRAFGPTGPAAYGKWYGALPPFEFGSAFKGYMHRATPQFAKSQLAQTAKDLHRYRGF